MMSGSARPMSTKFAIIVLTAELMLTVLKSVIRLHQCNSIHNYDIIIEPTLGQRANHYTK